VNVCADEREGKPDVTDRKTEQARETKCSDKPVHMVSVETGVMVGIPDDRDHPFRAIVIAIPV
jgi:hypothetical protein